MLLNICETCNAQINVSLSTITKQSIASDEYVPIVIGNVTGQNITSFQFNIFYNKNVIYITDISSNGSEISGISNPVFNADTANGVLRVAWASAFPLSGSGVLVNIKLTYHGYGYSDLTFSNPIDLLNSFRFNGGNPTAITKDGSVTIGNSQSSFAISGKVTYYNSNSSPIKNVKITLIGQTGTLSTTTDINGNYSFTGLIPGTYLLSSEKHDNWGGVNSTDALLISRYFLNLSSLDQIQKLVADVNNNGSINSTDALLIVKRFNETIQSFSISDWVFIPNSLNIFMTNSNVIQNLIGIAAGDVNQSLTP